MDLLFSSSFPPFSFAQAGYIQSLEIHKQTIKQRYINWLYSMPEVQMNGYQQSSRPSLRIRVPTTFLSLSVQKIETPPTLRHMKSELDLKRGLIQPSKRKFNLFNLGPFHPQYLNSTLENLLLTNHSFGLSGKSIDCRHRLVVSSFSRDTDSLFFLFHDSVWGFSNIVGEATVVSRRLSQRLRLSRLENSTLSKIGF